MNKESKKLTINARKHIKAKNFALSNGRYPIHDINHARSALAMIAKYGTPEEKGRVKASVYKKYPSLKPINKEASDKLSLYLAQVKKHIT